MIVKTLLRICLTLGLAVYAMGCSDDNVNPAPLLAFSPETLPGGTLNEPYAETVTVLYNVTLVGEINASAGQLPPGLTVQYPVNADSAVIAGTPEVLGTYHFTVTAWCYGTNQSGQRGEKEYTIYIAE